MKKKSGGYLLLLVFIVFINCPGEKIGDIASTKISVVIPKEKSAEFFPAELENTNFYLIMKKGKVGFMDKSGREMIKPVFEYANAFSEGLAVVKDEGKWGFINYNGETVIPPEYDFITRNFIGGVAGVLIEGKDMAISIKQGSISGNLRNNPGNGN